MKIGPRILTGYAATLLIFATVSAIAYRANKELSQSTSAVVHTYQVRRNLTGILASLTDTETGQRGYLLTGRYEYLDSYLEGTQSLDRYMTEVRRLTVDNSIHQARLAALRSAISEKLKEVGETIELRKQDKVAAALQIVLTNRGKSMMDEIRNLVAAMDQEESSLLDARTRSTNERARLASQAIVFGLLIALVTTILIAILVQRSIVLPLTSFMDLARKVGEGDLTQSARLERKDELGQLANYLHQMIVGLRTFARQSVLAAENVGAAAAEILASIQQQASSTAEQVAAIQQANATMEELTQSGKQISDLARQVAAAAEAVSSSSTSGLQSVKDTDQTMESITEQAETVAENVIALSEKTQAVGEIIASVNDIAEQSHLLALNASLQAAAAGEYGRSFSVVATEIKNLASQSKQATIQVRSILGDIQKGINTSVMLTEEAVKRADTGRQQSQVADRSIRQLAGNLDESIRAFQQIVAGSAQQQIGFEQVSQAFRSIGAATQETASSTRQSEKAIANLNALTLQLRSAVEQYHVGTGD